jgi:ribulose-phosphate 3-epimerase
MPLVSASVLAADLSNLKNEVVALESGGVDMLHFDVMDGHFVPNLTFGAEVVRSVRNITNLPFDVHLMMQHPMQYLDDFVAAGSNTITVHLEAVTHLDAAITAIKQRGCKAGVALNPSTNEALLKYVISRVDMVLVMTVNPGFCGQKFLPEQLTKIRNINKMLEELNPKALLSVDGGINQHTAQLCAAAGAGMLVSGSYLFGSESVYDSIAILRTS